ncbi:helix-turn-helix transcriptional regulator [bacterium]|nr:helix-turn-helix transcriptional regulator [bacterium]
MTQPATTVPCAPPTAGGAATAEAPSAALAALLDALPRALLLVDADAGVRFANAAAGDLLRRGGALRVSGHRLLAAGAADTQRLRHAVAAAHGQAQRRTLLALRGAGAEVLTLLLWSVAAPAEALVAVFAADHGPAVLNLALLRRLHGLTPAEARIAARLAAGGTLDDIAAELRVRRSTVRTHLQRVLAKTGAARQSELARLLLSGAAALRLPPGEIHQA